MNPYRICSDVNAEIGLFLGTGSACEYSRQSVGFDDTIWFRRSDSDWGHVTHVGVNVTVKSTMIMLIQLQDLHDTKPLESWLLELNKLERKYL